MRPVFVSFIRACRVSVDAFDSVYEDVLSLSEDEFTLAYGDKPEARELYRDICERVGVKDGDPPVEALSIEKRTVQFRIPVWACEWYEDEAVRLRTTPNKLMAAVVFSHASQDKRRRRAR